MKIGGFHTTGPLKGTAKKLSDTELAAEVVKDEFCKRSPEGMRRLVYGVTVSSINIQAGRSGLANTKHNDPRTFTASGSISYKVLVGATDRLRKMQTPATFSICFKEAVDDMGQPDAALISYTEVI